MVCSLNNTSALSVLGNTTWHSAKCLAVPQPPCSIPASSLLLVVMESDKGRRGNHTLSWMQDLICPWGNCPTSELTFGSLYLVYVCRWGGRGPPMLWQINSLYLPLAQCEPLNASKLALGGGDVSYVASNIPFNILNMNNSLFHLMPFWIYALFKTLISIS